MKSLAAPSKKATAPRGAVARLRNDERRFIACDYHRNGVSGVGFHVVLFDWKDPDHAEWRHMSAIVFEEPGFCAVLDTAETMAGNIQFARGNSWRGDHFEDDCRKWIAEEQQRQDDL